MKIMVLLSLCVCVIWPEGIMKMPELAMETVKDVQQGVSKVASLGGNV